MDDGRLVLLTIGSANGLAEGNTLDVYRLDRAATNGSKYLGRIKIIEATQMKTVGQPMGKLAGPVKVGDQVTSRILGDEAREDTIH